MTDFDVVYTLHVSLKGSRPLIWRRLEVPGVCPMNVLGKFILGAMDWDGSHLWEFSVDGLIFNQKSDVFPWLQDVAEEGGLFTWLYDFGDHWLHEIRVEKVETRPGTPWLLHLLGGERACPPDDVGGIQVWQDYVEHWQDPDHPASRCMLEWLDETPDPGGLNLKEDFDHLRYYRHQRFNLPFLGEAEDLVHHAGLIPVLTIGRMLIEADRWKPVFFETLRRLREAEDEPSEAESDRFPTIIIYLLAGMQARDVDGVILRLITLDRELLDLWFPYLEDADMEWGRLLAHVSEGHETSLVSFLEKPELTSYQKDIVVWALTFFAGVHAESSEGHYSKSYSESLRSEIESRMKEIEEDELGEIGDVAEELSMILGENLDVGSLLDEKPFVTGMSGGGTLGRQTPFRRTTPKVGRNDPCPCGSGKKFKKCCGG